MTTSNSEPKFSIETEAGRKLLSIVLRGNWDHSTIEAYDLKLREASHAMTLAGCPRHEILALVDAREAVAQSQQVITSYKDRFGLPDRQPKRIATVLSSTLFKFQVRRISLPNQKIFEDKNAAIQWLLSEDQ